MNCPVLDGAIDMDASDVVRFSSGRVMTIEKFVFRGEVLSDHPVFRIAELPSWVLVNADFVARAADSALTGLRTELIWSDERDRDPSVPRIREKRQNLTAAELTTLDHELVDDYLWDVACVAAGGETANDLAAMTAPMRAFYATRLFEWEVGNGGLHQFFFNHPEPEMIEAVKGWI